MTGLDKIIEKIGLDAKTAGDKLQAKADARCAQLLADAQSECDRIDAKAETDANALYSDILARGESSAQMQRKNRILTAKQEMIHGVIDAAKQKLLGLNSIDYFVLLGKLAEKYAQSGDGVMYLSASDLARVPAYFRSSLAGIGEKKGGSLVLSDEPRDLGGGFVLAYGGIEENCTFEALFEENKERLQDVVRETLFS